MFQVPSFSMAWLAVSFKNWAVRLVTGFYIAPSLWKACIFDPEIRATLGSEYVV